MKRNSRTGLFLTVMLAAPLLASTFASRRQGPELIPATIQASEFAAAEKKGSDNRPLNLRASAPMPAHFEAFKIQGRKSIAELESRLGADAFTAVLKINRTDKKHLRTADLLFIPDAGVDLLSIAPFPTQLEVARTIPKLLLVSRRVQAFGAFESGRLVRWGPTSTGKKSTPTPAGLYHTNWKAKLKRSSINQSWILPWCFNLDDLTGVSFHQFDLPGYPASHGCVRLLEEDAKWIYEWADQWTRSKADDAVVAYGTPVLIFGEFAYGEQPAWKRLADDPAAAAVSVEESEAALNQHLTTIAIKSPVRRPSADGAVTSSSAVAALPN
jgi:lipoprotein-anchoring transpeptidase ErfK/SrfK